MKEKNAVEWNNLSSKKKVAKIIKKMQEIEVKEDVPPITENNIKDE